MPLNYSKWDNIELSDDEDNFHRARARRADPAAFIRPTPSLAASAAPFYYPAPAARREGVSKA